jgi:hypothetical protein
MDKLSALAADEIEWAITLLRARIIRACVGHVLFSALHTDELHRAIFLTHGRVRIKKNVAVL